jgi:hypothetical protein
MKSKTKRIISSVELTSFYVFLELFILIESAVNFPHTK